MAKPNVSKVVELARKRKAAAAAAAAAAPEEEQVSEREARKKRREEKLPQNPAPSPESTPPRPVSSPASAGGIVLREEAPAATPVDRPTVGETREAGRVIIDLVSDLPPVRPAVSTTARSEKPPLVVGAPATPAASAQPAPTGPPVVPVPAVQPASSIPPPRPIASGSGESSSAAAGRVTDRAPVVPSTVGGPTMRDESSAAVASSCPLVGPDIGPMRGPGGGVAPRPPAVSSSGPASSAVPPLFDASGRLPFPPTWPEVSRPPGMSAWFTSAEQVQVDKTAEGILQGIGVSLKRLDVHTIPDGPRITDLGPFQNEKATRDANLAEKIMKAVLLPKDREETQGRRPEGSSRRIFGDLLRATHSAAILSENYATAVDLSRRAVGACVHFYREAARCRLLASGWEAGCEAREKLISKRVEEATRRDRELAALREQQSILEELAKSQDCTVSEQKHELDHLREKSGTWRAENEDLKKKLTEVRAESAGLQQHVDSLIKEKAQLVADAERTLKERDEEICRLRDQVAVELRKNDTSGRLLRDSRAEVDRLANELRVKTAAVEEQEGRIQRAIADYKASPAFAEEIDEAGSFSFAYGFDAGLQQVKKSYPDLDVSQIEMPEVPGDEAGNDAENAVVAAEEQAAVAGEDRPADAGEDRPADAEVDVVAAADPHP